MGKHRLNTRSDDRTAPRDGSETATPSRALRAVVARGYAVFSRYTLDEPLDVCTRCCVGPDDYGALLRTPLRQLDVRLLREFNDTAQSNTPSLNQLKVFWPRYMELIAWGRVPSHSTELAMIRFAPFDAGEFTNDENDVIDAFMVELFREVLRADPAAGRFDTPTSYLLMFLASRRDITAVCRTWQQTLHRDALLHLCDLLVNHVQGDGDEAAFVAPFADSWMSDVVIGWLRAPETRAAFSPALEALLVDGGLSEPESDLLNWGYEVLNPR